MQLGSKLKTQEICKLKSSFDNLSFSCGADLQDAELPADLKNLVYVKNNAL